MISFAEFVPVAGVPIYLQILRYIQRGAAAGRIQNGDELPSRRVLSALLGVNPNTVQKAYRLLEEKGLVCSHTGAKSYMVLNAETVQAIRQELLESEVRALVTAMRQTGANKEDTLALISKIWDEDECGVWSLKMFADENKFKSSPQGDSFSPNS